MLADSEINKYGTIFSHLFLVGSAGFFKKLAGYLPPPGIFMEIWLNIQKRGRGIGNYVICKDA